MQIGQLSTPLYFTLAAAVLKLWRWRPAKVGSLLSRQMYVGRPHMDYPNGFAASEPKNRQQQNPVYRPRLTRVIWYDHQVFTTKAKMFSSQNDPGAKGLLPTIRAVFF